MPAAAPASTRSTFGSVTARSAAGGRRKMARRRQQLSQRLCRRTRCACILTSSSRPLRTRIWANGVPSSSASGRSTRCFPSCRATAARRNLPAWRHPLCNPPPWLIHHRRALPHHTRRCCSSDSSSRDCTRPTRMRVRSACESPRDRMRASRLRRALGSEHASRYSSLAMSRRRPSKYKMRSASSHHRTPRAAVVAVPVAAARPAPAAHTPLAMAPTQVTC
mmetsp:Transcript_20684/g.52696  ORF Transcript_20684/g.52696 Transcript_20684/m.52696 type:complete len:221 (-) Transcript_20684:1121-1783(-)